jgi:xylulokinase
MAVSASGREIFPVDKTGRPLGPCIMAGDIRGAELAAQTASTVSRREWYDACGHIPERMDPVNRWLWWRQHHLETFSRAAAMVGWHEYLTLRLVGRAVTDRSLASKWCIYQPDGQWSQSRAAQFDMDTDKLPEIQDWGTMVGRVKASLAARLGLPKGIQVAVGAFDASCAAVGTGALREGVTALVSGTWEDLIAPTGKMPELEVLDAGFSVGPHPGNAGLGMFALSPNGTVVVDWARKLLGLSLRKLKQLLETSGVQPSPVLAVPHFSGATVCWPEGRRSRGGFLGLTLASSPDDMIKALLESVAYDLDLMADAFRHYGMRMDRLRAVGGGARSAWWTQLKADLIGLPIEVIQLQESGTVGAALLAGLASGDYASLEEGAELFVRVTRQYEPDQQRAALHQEKLESYRHAVNSILHHQLSGPTISR